MTASFLGVTIHCFTFHEKQRHNILLAVRRLESPHTGRRIADLLQGIAIEWNIPHQKIFRSFTDNGSNMVKAFKELSNEGESVEIEEDESLTELTDADLEGNKFDDGLSEDSDSEDLDEPEATTAEDQMKEFEQHENDHAVTLVGWKRNSCFTHTLQLVVKEFEKSPCYKSSITKEKKVVKKFNKSCKATEKLIKLAGKKLVSNRPTRWDSMFLMLSRLVCVKSQVKIVMEELGWNGLSVSQWKQIQIIVELLQPFAHATNVASSEDNTSIGMVIPILKELELHLKEVSHTSSWLAHVCEY